MKCEKSKKIVSCLSDICEKKNLFLEKYFSLILLFVLRIMMASLFFQSGMAKFSNMESAVYLFEFEYQLPFISPVFAAYSATFIELTCSLLLVVGLATRLAALAFIAMTLVIQFLVIQNPQHFYWLAILATIFCFGPGCLSIDRLIKKFCGKCKK
jgi:putative oxidoreductase